MKKTGILHGELARCIATMGHKDQILIGDAGMPVPKGVPLIDLALTNGVPSFVDVLKVVLTELCVEEGIVATEMRHVSPHMAEQVDMIIGDSFKVKAISHTKMKEQSKDIKAVIRTGEFTPYANIILEAGVVF